MESEVRSACFRGDFTIKTVVAFVRKISLEKDVVRLGIFYSYAILLVVD